SRWRRSIDVPSLRPPWVRPRDADTVGPARPVVPAPPLGAYSLSCRLPSPPGHGASPELPALSDRRLSYRSWTAVSSSTATRRPLGAGGGVVRSATSYSFLFGSPARAPAGGGGRPTVVGEADFRGAAVIGRRDEPQRYTGGRATRPFIGRTSASWRMLGPRPRWSGGDGHAGRGWRPACMPLDRTGPIHVTSTSSRPHHSELPRVS